jgi:uncharacterized membrane protein
MTFTQAMDDISRAFEVVGVAILVLGFVIASVRAVPRYLQTRNASETYRFVRSFFGRSILLGLEVLVAADLIRTVAVDPTLENVAVLGLIVIIRTVLSFSLEIEIDGRLPWRRAMETAPGATSQSHDPAGRASH